MSNSAFFSLHTFILPFIWKHEETKTIFNSFERIFATDRWKLLDVLGDFRDDRCTTEELTEKKRLFYNEYRYFYPQAQKAIYDNREDIVRTFVYQPKQKSRDAEYIIEKGADTYRLKLNEVEVKIYSTGVGMFVLKCENDQFEHIAEIKKINNYGRMVNAPSLFCTDEENISTLGAHLCADRLTLAIDGKRYVSTFESSMLNRFSALTVLCDFAEQLLSETTNAVFTSDIGRIGKRGRSEAVYITQALDERMIVQCYCRNNALVTYASAKTKNGYGYKDRIMRSNLYELIFMDPQDACSCQYDELCDELIDESLYLRWINYKTMYAVTPNMFLTLVNGSEPAYLVDHYRTMYYQMLCLVIAQRISLIAFQNELTEIAREKKENKQTERLLRLQKNFSMFEASMFFEEITPQQQGIEMYLLMRKNFMIHTEAENVKSQISGLTEAANTYHDSSINKLGFILAVICIPLSVIEAVLAILQFGKNVTLGTAVLCSLAVVGISVLAVLIFIKAFEKKHIKKR